MADTLTFTRNEDGTIGVDHRGEGLGGVTPAATHYGAACLFMDWLRGGEGAPTEEVLERGGPIQPGPDKFPAPTA